MTAARDFGDMMPQSVTIAPKTGSDRFNNPTYGTPVTHKCLLTEQNQMVRSFQGEEVVSNTVVYLDAPARPELAPESQITLPDGRQPPILSISRYSDDVAEYVAVVYL
jgi:hypothetical protein